MPAAKKKSSVPRKKEWAIMYYMMARDISLSDGFKKDIDALIQFLGANRMTDADVFVQYYQPSADGKFTRKDKPVRLLLSAIMADLKQWKTEPVDLKKGLMGSAASIYDYMHWVCFEQKHRYKKHAVFIGGHAYGSGFSNHSRKADVNPFSKKFTRTLQAKDRSEFIEAISLQEDDSPYQQYIKRKAGYSITRYKADTDMTVLHSYEMSMAFTRICLQLNSPLDLVVMDGCYMGSYEMLLNMHGLAQYVIASPTTLSMSGLNHESNLNFLYKKPTASARDFGFQIRDSYFENKMNHRWNMLELSLCLYDMKGMTNLRLAMENLMSHFFTKKYDPYWLAVMQARNCTKEFDPQVDTCFADAYDFFGWLRSFVPTRTATDKDIKKAVTGVMKTMKKVCLYRNLIADDNEDKYTRIKDENRFGLNIYFPRSAPEFYLNYSGSATLHKGQSLTDAGSPNTFHSSWLVFLMKYYVQTNKLVMPAITKALNLTASNSRF